MRLLTLVLITVFSLQVLDIPPVRNTPNPKTCCGRTVCLCTHPKGGFCPFRDQQAKRSEHAGAAQHAEKHSVYKHSHLTKTSGHTAAVNPERSQAASSQPVSFSKAPCHTDAPKTAMTRGAFQDFDILPFKGFSVHFDGKFIPLLFPEYPKPLFVSSIDHPPKPFISI